MPFSAMWFQKDAAFDQKMREEFLDLHQEMTDASSGVAKRQQWRKEFGAEGYLAEIILIDQFSRNMFRDTKESFAFDSLALEASWEAIGEGLDKAFMDAESPESPNFALAFFYMPFMHSESAEDQKRAVEELYSLPCLKQNHGYAVAHKRIIDMFGRYPHRNAILGRETTEEEQIFLDTDAVSSF